jgi:hypothetical protein
MRTEIRGLHKSSALPEWETAVPEPLACVQLGSPELRRQIVDIILDVLSDAEPVRPEVRERMLQHLADNPGHPERALLDHLRDPDLRTDAAPSGILETEDV